MRPLVAMGVVRSPLWSVCISADLFYTKVCPLTAVLPRSSKPAKFITFISTPIVPPSDPSVCPRMFFITTATLLAAIAMLMWIMLLPAGRAAC